MGQDTDDLVHPVPGTEAKAWGAAEMEAAVEVGAGGSIGMGIGRHEHVAWARARGRGCLLAGLRRAPACSCIGDWHGIGGSGSVRVSAPVARPNVLMGGDRHRDDSDSTEIGVYRARWSVRRDQLGGGG